MSTKNSGLWAVLIAAVIAGALSLGGWLLLVWLAKVVWFA